MEEHMNSKTVIETLLRSADLMLLRKPKSAIISLATMVLSVLCSVLTNSFYSASYMVKLQTLLHSVESISVATKET